MAQTLSDSELVARCRSGDQQAWAELVDRFSRYVYAISVQAFRLPDADAEDVFQEVFARAYEHLDGFFARDESYRTIGEALDLPAGTIASRISRCLRRLREFLEGRTVPDPPS